MGRTIAPTEEREGRRGASPLPETPVRSRRSLPPEEPMFCHWKCPCGGTVPDAPEYCLWRFFVARSGKWCCEAAFCAWKCEDNVTCEAYRKYQIKVRELYDI